jgi:hypothetical protein
MALNPESGCTGPPHTSVTTPESRNGPEAADILDGTPLRVQQLIKTKRLAAENVSNFFLQLLPFLIRFLQIRSSRSAGGA